MSAGVMVEMAAMIAVALTLSRWGYRVCATCSPTTQSGNDMLFNEPLILHNCKTDDCDY